MKKPNLTKGKWKWIQPDKSTLILSGSDGIENHVLAMSPCKSCQERIKDDESIMGKCTVVKSVDAKAISAVPEMIDALIELNEFIELGIESGYDDLDTDTFYTLLESLDLQTKKALKKAGCTE